MGNFDKSVKGATKPKAAPPKTKYIEHILIATHAGEAGVAELFRSLQFRLQDSTWTVVLKCLITIHLMIREGSPDVTLAHLARNRGLLDINMFSDVQTHGRTIRHYTNYLLERTRAYKETKMDWVRGRENRLEKLPVEKGLLRETEIVQAQLTALLKCELMDDERADEITITIFRLLVLDLLVLFRVLNLGMINILGHFFEMSKPDAERAMSIYRNFTRQTDYVVIYLTTARQYEHRTRVEVPRLKHAPVHLGRQLEDYLNDPDFEINRRQYLTELEAKKKSKPAEVSAVPKLTKKTEAAAKAAAAADSAKVFDILDRAATPTNATKVAAQKPDSTLIDFFESIGRDQTPIASQGPFQPPPPQQQQLTAPAMTGAMSSWGPTPGTFQYQMAGQDGLIAQQTGFQYSGSFPQANTMLGGFPPTQRHGGFQSTSLGSIPQETVASFQTGSMNGVGLQGMQPSLQQQQSTNPFRQSTMMAHPTSATLPSNGQQRPATSQGPGGLVNPFAKPSPPAAQPFNAPPAPVQQAMHTGGINPFSQPFGRSSPDQPHSLSRPVTAAALMSQPTGSTNPFRQSSMNPGQPRIGGWAPNQPLIGGGLDNVETVAVFPRPPVQRVPIQHQPAWGM